jgi:rare lipoprotein A (peptidoglycan hydrolase)
MAMGLPLSGNASTYSNNLSGKLTASGQPYSPNDFSAALLPKSNWYALSLGTLVKLTYLGRSVVVKVNDRGAGEVDKNGINRDPRRVLDLSRAATAVLLNISPGAVTDSSAGVISIDHIEVVSPGTPLGPWKKK